MEGPRGDPPRRADRGCREGWSGPEGGPQKNDVVIGCQGKEIPDSATFRNEVAQTPSARRRDSRSCVATKKVMTAKVGSLEEATALFASALKERLGAEVRSPNRKEVEKYGLDANQAVVITRVDSKRTLGQAGSR